MCTIIQRFIRSNSIIFSVVICICTLLISSLFNWDEYAVMGIDKLIGDVLITLVCFLCIHILNLKVGLDTKGLKRGLILGIPFIIIGILGAIIGNLGVDFNTLSSRGIPFIILFTINMFFVGVNEEILMRGLVLNILLSKYEDKKQGTLKAISISALIFGAIHVPNLFFIEPMTVIVQVINAAAAGILFAVIYIFCKNLWAVIIVHALVDWISLFIGQCFYGGESVLSMHMNIGQGLVMILLGSVPPIVTALCFIKFIKAKV